jgi:U3 small nucleolar RNA-associated protein 6
MADAGKESVPSVSYARDVYLDGKGSAEEQQTNLTNLDGLYAADDIEAGTVVFRESEMPDCELHRTRENPNCEIVELEDGEGAIVSCRGIKAGEFFCIMESDDSDFDGDEGDFESEEEEEEGM